MWVKARGYRHRQVGWREGKTWGDRKAALGVRGRQDPTGQRGVSRQGKSTLQDVLGFPEITVGRPGGKEPGRDPAAIQEEGVEDSRETQQLQRVSQR